MQRSSGAGTVAERVTSWLSPVSTTPTPYAFNGQHTSDSSRARSLSLPRRSKGWHCAVFPATSHDCHWVPKERIHQLGWGRRPFAAAAAATAAAAGLYTVRLQLSLPLPFPGHHLPGAGRVSVQPPTPR